MEKDTTKLIGVNTNEVVCAVEATAAAAASAACVAATASTTVGWLAGSFVRSFDGLSEWTLVYRCHFPFSWIVADCPVPLSAGRQAGGPAGSAGLGPRIFDLVRSSRSSPRPTGLTPRLTPLVHFLVRPRRPSAPFRTYDCSQVMFSSLSPDEALRRERTELEGTLHREFAILLGAGV